MSGHRAAVTPRLVTVGMNLAGALAAALFARASLLAYLHSHRLTEVLFFAEQLWFVAAFLIRRPARVVTRRIGDWLLAYAGTFGGLLLRPVGAHPAWGVRAGVVLQVVGLVIALTSLIALGRSFGFAAADRGLVSRGPYGLVRHPIYAAYVLVQCGYLTANLAWWNLAVVVGVTCANMGRAVVEERLLAASGEYGAYRERVRWRILPGVW